MGSIQEDDAQVQEHAITVLVTGFGPFQERYPVNPSFEIARSLPQLLTRSASGRTPVQVIGYGTPIRVCYETARELIPPLLQGYSNTVDLVLHIGMASGRQYYTAERYAHREGYDKYKDLDGKVPPPEEAETLFAECPPLMETSLDFDSVVQNWQSMVANAPQDTPAHGADCRSSKNAGNYLCDYTYWNSLVWYGRHNKKLEDVSTHDRPVLFLHVPAESDEKSLATGRAVATSLIHAMVEDFVGASSAPQQPRRIQ